MNEPTHKRAVSTDALETLGKIHTRTEHRDAIHLAVEPVTAGQRLKPGDHISVTDGVAWLDIEEPIGIVDPFLKEAVRKGERFWFVMYPRAVHSLRHVWTHPSFPDVTEAPVVAADDPRAEAEAWLRGKADEWGFSYHRLLDVTNSWVQHGDECIGGSELEGVWVPEEFWPRYDLVVGKVTPDRKRENFFGCSC